MKKGFNFVWWVILLTLWAMCLIIPVAIIGSNANTPVSPVELVRAMVLSQGQDAAEMGVPIKVFRKAGMTGGGFWHFFTFKVYKGNTVAIVYQPEKASVLIIRSDVEPYSGDKIFSFYILSEHTTGTWSFYNIGEKAANELVGMILNTMDSCVQTPFGFTLESEMRSDLCWEIKGQ